MTLEDFRVTIGDHEIDPAKRASIAVYNPADLGEQIGSVPSLTPEDVAEAFTAAEHAQRAWRGRGLLGRGAVFTATAVLIRARAEELTALIVRENGKLWAEAAGEVGKAADFFEYYGSFARQPYGTLLADARPDTQTSMRREPLGVVLLITPWNDPLLTPARKLAPALMSGNAVILKPSTDTPLIALALADILAQAGLEPGALTIATGRSSEISSALLEAPQLAAVSFTGSTLVGNQLRASLAHRNVRIQTEMGGKNAAVVADSADVAWVVDNVIAAAFAQAGQRCTSTSRLIVGPAIADDVIEGLREATRRLKAGPGSDKTSTFGPVINAGASKQILDYIAVAQSDGAVLAGGGGALTDGSLGKGAFVAPTILDSVGVDNTVWREEIFGPVLSIHRLESGLKDPLGDAIRLANDSDYGLAASIYTNDLDEALEFTERADAGQVSVNLPTSGWDVHHPFGGFGDSGSGYKEQGQEALTFYTRIKTVAIRYNTRPRS